MVNAPAESGPAASALRTLLPYVADLELEVDRLRKQGRFIQQEAWDTLKRIQLICAEASQEGNQHPLLGGIDHAAREFAGLLRDLQEPAGYHPAHDQVVAIAIRLLTEQVFRGQQRLLRTPNVALRLELESEHVEWFPGRLRHILENLLSNALKYRDRAKTEAWVQLQLRVAPEAYEFRVSDNGIGMPPSEYQQMFALFYRAAPARAARMGVGLAVVKLLVEQSGGTLTVDSGEGKGTCFIAVVPRYDVNDFLT